MGLPIHTSPADVDALVEKLNVMFVCLQDEIWRKDTAGEDYSLDFFTRYNRIIRDIIRRILKVLNNVPTDIVTQAISEAVCEINQAVQQYDGTHGIHQGMAYEDWNYIPARLTQWVKSLCSALQDANASGFEHYVCEEEIGPTPEELMRRARISG